MTTVRAHVLLLALASACAAPQGSGPREAPERTELTAAVLSASGGYVALEEELASDLLRELRQPPETRPPLRGAPVHEDLLDALAKVRSETRRLDWCDREPWKALKERLGEGQIPERIPAELVRANESVAPAVSAARVALARDVVRRHYDLARDAASFVGGAALDEAEDLEAGFVLQAIDALGDHAAVTARLATDLWRLEDDILRDERLGRGRFYDLPAWTPAVLISAAIGSLDARELDALDAELVMLEKTLPSMTRYVRVQRLALGCRFRGRARGDGPPPSGPGDDRIFIDTTDLSPEVDRLSPDERRAAARLRSIAATWGRCDHELRLREGAVDGLSPSGAWSVASAPESTPGPLSSDAYAAHEVLELVALVFNDHLCRMGYLRLLRVLVAARRFHLVHGAWPRTLEDALGRPPGEEERSPFDRSSMRLESGAGVIAVRLHAEVSPRISAIGLTCGPIPRPRK